MRTNLIQHFEREKLRCETSLNSAEKPGFRLVEIVAGRPDVEVTARHIEHLRRAIDEYQRMIDYLKTAP